MSCNHSEIKTHLDRLKVELLNDIPTFLSCIEKEPVKFKAFIDQNKILLEAINELEELLILNSDISISYQMDESNTQQFNILFMKIKDFLLALENVLGTKDVINKGWLAIEKQTFNSFIEDILGEYPQSSLVDPKIFPELQNKNDEIEEIEIYSEGEYENSNILNIAPNNKNVPLSSISKNMISTSPDNSTFFKGAALFEIGLVLCCTVVFAYFGARLISEGINKMRGDSSSLKNTENNLYKSCYNRHVLFSPSTGHASNSIPNLS